MTNFAIGADFGRRMQSAERWRRKDPLGLRNLARHIAAKRKPRSVAELTPEQRVIYAALRQGAEGGLTVSIPVSVQYRRK